ncbi:hypothetical protein E2C01_047705 [Portunus trituberculatus]|uniref:Uncharacterized protein n=1 Tax=Portunus trituberculatus TaxID=210409 RepID=A0A5B7G8M1_PORTR|nr:hypothetical protein [Portunus trituberculatus]
MSLSSGIAYSENKNERTRPPRGVADEAFKCILSQGTKSLGRIRQTLKNRPSIVTESAPRSSLLKRGDLKPGGCGVPRLLVLRRLMCCYYPLLMKLKA